MQSRCRCDVCATCAFTLLTMRSGSFRTPAIPANSSGCECAQKVTHAAMRACSAGGIMQSHLHTMHTNSLRGYRARNEPHRGAPARTRRCCVMRRLPATDDDWPAWATLAVEPRAPGMARGPRLPRTQPQLCSLCCRPGPCPSLQAQPGACLAATLRPLFNVERCVACTTAALPFAVGMA